MKGASDGDQGGSPAWWVYRGSGRPADVAPPEFPLPPPWRTFGGRPPDGQGWPDLPVGDEESDRRQLGNQLAHAAPAPAALALVNAALLLRRPMLVTGPAGAGKSTLARSIASELGLGPVLHWPITSRSTRAEGLYEYDAIGRLQAAQLEKLRESSHTAVDPLRTDHTSNTTDVGRFIRLGPLGTALLPWSRPRVLLIDEIDKSDLDLPNDLLTLFEDGEFTIPELARLPAEQAIVNVLTADGGPPVAVERGRILCAEFPIVVLSSNGERSFSPPFLRRCIRLNMGKPDRPRLSQIIAAHLGPAAVERSEALIAEFLDRQTRAELATDQLLNAIFLASSGRHSPGFDSDLSTSLVDLFQPLNEAE